MNAFTVLGEIDLVTLWCNPRVCLGDIPTMAAWSNDGRLVKPVTVGREGSINYVAKEIALTASGKSGIITENVVIHEQLL
jgi:hypothetical protein